MAVVDTNVILHGRGEINLDDVFLTPGVIEEVQSSQGRNILHNINYQIAEPSKESIERVSEKSTELKSPTSEVDERLLALALELDDFLVTDDKALQNLALHLDVDLEGFHDEVLNEKFKWERRCSNCGRKVSTSQCSQCGSHRIRRKQVRCN